MKRSIILLVLIFLFPSLFALDCSVSMGYQQKYTNGIAHDPIFVSLKVYQDIGNFQIYGKYQNEFHINSQTTAMPTQDYYTVGISYEVGNTMVVLEHMCQHPVISDYTIRGITGGYTKIGITISSSNQENNRL